jgi:hypothetical protein
MVSICEKLLNLRMTFKSKWSEDGVYSCGHSSRYLFDLKRKIKNIYIYISFVGVFCTGK